MITKAILARELTKSELSRSHRIAELCIDAVLDSISRALSEGKRIELRGFGTFSVKKTAAHHTGINGHMAVPEHGRVIFQPCESLRRAAWDCGSKNAAK